MPSLVSSLNRNAGIGSRPEGVNAHSSNTKFIDLVIHEAGHTFAFFLPRFLYVLGGSALLARRNLPPAAVIGLDRSRRELKLDRVLSR